MARVSVSDWRWCSRLEVGFRNPKALAVVAMQLHLGAERLVEEARKYSDGLEVGRFGCGKRASRAVRPADCHARRTKFAELVAVVENVYCILILGVAGERDGSRAA